LTLEGISVCMVCAIRVPVLLSHFSHLARNNPGSCIWSDAGGWGLECNRLITTPTIFWAAIMGKSRRSYECRQVASQHVHQVLSETLASSSNFTLASSREPTSVGAVLLLWREAQRWHSHEKRPAQSRITLRPLPCHRLIKAGVLSAIAFHEKAGRSQVDSFLFDTFFLLPSHCRRASIRTLEERIVSLGACGAFSIQPVLPSA